MADAYFSGETSEIERLVADPAFDPGRGVAMVVNSYEQVARIKRHLDERPPRRSRRTVAVVDEAPRDAGADWTTASRVEELGARDAWDCVIFPLKALARGVNVVFTHGPRARQAAIGTVLFLTRPHPAAESLDLAAGLAGRTPTPSTGPRSPPTRR